MSDYDFNTRLALLAELMERNPEKRMKNLQREALKYYPLDGNESIRHWMSTRVAFLAADIANKTLMEDLNDESN